MIQFKIEDRNDNSRAGVLNTPDGLIHTPVFMPVGTLATVKGMTTKEIKELGAEIILGNTYHLHLRPSDSVIRKLSLIHI